MKKIVRNEFKKFCCGKIFFFELLLIVCLCFLAVYAYKEMSINVINDLPKAQLYSADMKNALMNLDGVVFAKLFLSDFIYKGYFSFFLVFSVIIAVNTFATDRESGNMKFTLLVGIEGKKLVMAKIVFLFCVIVATVIFNLILSTTIGIFFFGLSSFLGEFKELIVLNFLAIFPAIAIVVLIAIISQIRISSKVVMTIGLMLVLVFGMLDTTTLSYYFSPIGALSLFAETVPVLKNTLVYCCIVSIVYICIGIGVIKVISSQYEYYE